MPPRRDDAADIVVIGAGASGLTAAIAAREAGASVIVVEARGPQRRPRHNQRRQSLARRRQQLPEEIRRRGFAGRAVPGFDRLDRGRAQRRATLPLQRPRDCPRVRRYSVATFEFLLAHGVRIVDQAPDSLSGHEIGMSAPRTLHCAAMDWPLVQTGKPADPGVRATTSSGNGLMQPLHAAARTGRREDPAPPSNDRHPPRAPARGRVTGIAVDHDGDEAKHPGAQGGHHRQRRLVGKRQFPPHVRPAAHRRILRPRRHAVVRSGRQRGTCRDGGRGLALGIDRLRRRVRHRSTKAGSIGCQYGYANLRWFPGSPVFDKARAIGLKVADWQNVILVNMLGTAFLRRNRPPVHSEHLRQFRALPAGRFP